ncbi:TPR-like protein [Melanomma pulvis-pyrius CBS 109.77]|uniref:TPR-like protein n=1 Tax=Melanomma pulvis-pyrius CBS 109.77 TaxID=1314802 RepID=A0A6A6XW15_9PLEO|nr:TPR-like protein [Melanomma pulvis-pyrius CBS 109.77]
MTKQNPVPQPTTGGETLTTTAELLQQNTVPQEQVGSYESGHSVKPPGKPAEKPPGKFRAFRITEVPKTTTRESLILALRLFLDENGEYPGEDAICGLSLAPDHNDPNTYYTATITFASEPKALKKCSSGPGEALELKIDDTPCTVQIDAHFTGMTTLHSEDPVIDIVAVSGLGGNGFGSWRAPGTANMWLRDFLPEKIKHSRIFIYGYDTELIGPGARSFASIRDMAKTLFNNLKMARAQPNEMRRPLVLLGHSLGGLVIKQALVEAATHADTSPPHKNLHDSFVGALFFGVPNRGLNDKFLHDIVHGQPNQKLISSLDPVSPELAALHRGFTALFDRKKYQFYSYYETRVTQLSEINRATGRLELTDKSSIMVLETSATEAVPSQARHNYIPIDGDHRSMIKFARKTDQYFQQVSSDILHLVSIAQAMIDKQSVQSATDGRSTYFLVPYQKNERYTPRSKLDNLLSRISGSTKAIALLGHGGTGKTQVALNLAFESRDTHSVFWIDGHTIESSWSSLISIGKQLGLATEEMKEKDLCQLLKKWLGSDKPGKWLAVIDNLTHTDSSVLDILSSGQGTLLVTTRQEHIHKNIRAHQLECASMTPDEAKKTFHTHSLLDVNDKTLDKISIAELLKALDHLPLAVALAASFIRETKTSVDDYLESLQKELAEHAKLLQNQVVGFESTALPTPAVLSSWYISFCRIQRDRATAADLFQLMSLLDTHSIPVDLLHSKVLGEIGLEKKSNVDTALGVLASYSLLTICKTPVCQVPELLAVCTQMKLGEKEEAFAKLALSLMQEVFSNQNSPRLVNYLPHTKAVFLHSGKIPQVFNQRVGFQGKLAEILNQSGRQSEARDLIRDCLEYYGSTKKDGMEYADCAYQLSLIEVASKDYDQAIVWCRNARDGFVKNLGQSHVRTLNVVGRIAMISDLQGNYSNAIHNYEQALVWSGATAPDQFTIDTIHNMALVFDKQGRYDIAIEAYTQALNDSIQVLGEQHPSTLDIEHNMAISMRKQGRYNEALETFKHVADAYARILGKTDRATIDVQGNIALIDDIQGRHTAALQTYKWVLEAKEKSLGKKAPSTLSTLSNMALLLSKTGRHDDAVAAAQRALDGYQEVLGNEDPVTLDAVANVAIICAAAGDVPQAKAYFEHASWGKAKQIGMEHPSTLGTLAAFAALLVRLGSFEEALSIQTSVLSGYAAILGKEHPFAVEAEVGLAKVLEGLKRWDEAKACLMGVVELWKNQEGQKGNLEAAEGELKKLTQRMSGKIIGW